MAAKVVVDVVALSLGGLPAEEFEELEGDFAGAVEFGLVGLSGYVPVYPDFVYPDKSGSGTRRG